LASEIDTFTANAPFKLYLYSLAGNMKYYYSSAIKIVMRKRVCCRRIFIIQGLQGILTGELSPQVTKEAINMFAYLP